MLLPVAAAAIFYAPGFHGFWLGDDLPNLHRTWQWAQSGTLWSDTARQFVTPITGGGAFIRPMVIASFSLDYAMTGASYGGWYAFNFAAHLANVALVAFIVLRLARLAAVAGALTAALAACFFGLAPLIAEGVYWLSARGDACVTLCSLGAIAVWIRDEEHGTRHAVWAYPLLAAVALAFKESAAILPLQMAVLAWGWPTASRRRSHIVAVIAGFAVLAAYFAWRGQLFGAMFGTYLGTGEAQANVLDRVSTAAASLPLWWAAVASLRPSHGIVYLATGAAALVVALAASRGPQLRLAASLAAASGGLLAATLFHLGGLQSSGEGGRLLYGPFAWLALAIGIAIARNPAGSAIARRAATALVAFAAITGAALLHVTLREVAHAQDDSRALVEALARWARSHDDPVMAVIPENRGPVVLYRNGQGGIVLPPVQENAILDHVIPALPSDIPKRYGEFANGVVTRLIKLAPSRANAEVLKQLFETDEPRWPGLVCWNAAERRLVTLPAADPSDRDRWIRQTRAAARACLPDEPSFASP